jgi:hypothetical protein
MSVGGRERIQAWRDGYVTRPRIRAEARLSGLRERPQSEDVCAFQTLRMEVAAILFLEGDAEGPTVELAACLGFNHNRPKPAMNRAVVLGIFSMASPLPRMSGSMRNKHVRLRPSN